MQNFFSGLPGVLLIVVLSVVASYIAISLIEHQVHQNLMHKRRLPKWAYRVWPYIMEIYEGHAVRHHGIWYRDFDFEPHPDGRHDNIDIRLVETAWLFLAFAPIMLVFFAVSPIAGVVWIIMGIAHDRLWNILHNQMHMPEPVFFADWGLYRWLARHHFMHHQATNKNYNIVFPFADFVLGTVSKPRIRDLREMMRLGYLKPKSRRAKARLEAIRTKVEYSRRPLVEATV